MSTIDGGVLCNKGADCGVSCDNSDSDSSLMIKKQYVTRVTLIYAADIPIEFFYLDLKVDILSTEQ